MTEPEPYPYAKAEHLIATRLVLRGSVREAIADLVEAGLILPDAHPLTQGEFYTWHYEDGYENDLMGGPIKFPPQSSWKGPARPGHNPIVKVERKRWYISHWDEEPEDCSEEAKATPYVDPWTHEVIE